MKPRPPPCSLPPSLRPYHNGYFGLVPNPDFPQVRGPAPDFGPGAALAGPAVAGERDPILRWMPYVTEVDDQRQSGMCQAFSSMIKLRILLRAKLDPEVFTGDVDDPGDDLTLDPRPGHRLGHAEYYPGKPYSHLNGLPAGTTLRVLREKGWISPGTRTERLSWDIGEMAEAVRRGPVEFPLVIHDGYGAARLHPTSREIPRPLDPTARLGGHSMCAFLLRWFGGVPVWTLANSWDPATWGFHGTAQIRHAHAEWSALDTPYLLVMDDPEWYEDNDQWRQLLIRRSDLAAALRRLPVAA